MDEQKRRQTTTIRDVARLAGVSIGTVSKALNNSGSLRKETRDRIIALADNLGFRPNDLAQSLHRRQSFTVGLISNDSFGRFSMPIMEGLEACLAEQRISVFMCNATDAPERERQHIDQLLGKRVDGLVATARRIDRRPTLSGNLGGVPIVYVFSQTDDPEAVCLLPDDEGGAVLACEHLLRLGRRRIAHITGPENFEAVRLRHQGYIKTLANAGLTPADGDYLPGVWSEQWGYEAVNSLFRPGRIPPDALFCGNDQIARGAADALREQGIQVPRDVALVGFDNWAVMTDACRPALTSIDLNLHQMGREAGLRLIAMINGEILKGTSRLPCTLVVRDSCGGKTVQAN